jgi:hypothetical protein
MDRPGRVEVNLHRRAWWRQALIASIEMLIFAAACAGTWCFGVDSRPSERGTTAKAVFATGG